MGRSPDLFLYPGGADEHCRGFDSLWYGVRSPYILDNGRGIYENMGNIGIVYTYSKGFEVLTLPLSVLPSYSFLTAFNLWLLAGILWIFGKILRICVGTGEGGKTEDVVGGVEENRGAVCRQGSGAGDLFSGVSAWDYEYGDHGKKRCGDVVFPDDSVV